MAVENINTETFEALIAGDKPVLVDYWAPWCSYCRRIAPVFEKVAEQNADRLVCVKFDIDQDGALADREGIEVIPTLTIYRGGKAVGSVINPPSKAAIDAFIAETLGE